MTIGRLEIFFNRMWTWDAFTSHCDCKFLDLGPICFVWLSKDCNRPL